MPLSEFSGWRWLLAGVHGGGAPCVGIPLRPAWLGAPVSAVAR